MKVVKLLFANYFEVVNYVSTIFNYNTNSRISSHSVLLTQTDYRTLLSCYHDDSVVHKTMQTQFSNCQSNGKNRKRKRLRESQWLWL